jgi:hypothetical protein
VQRPNIQEQKEDDVKSNFFKRTVSHILPKVKWMIFNLIVPEVLVG